MSRVYQNLHHPNSGDIGTIKNLDKLIKSIFDFQSCLVKSLSCIIILCLTTNSFALKSFEPTNVIINLNKNLQPDSIGYNLPNDLPKLLYPKILDGTIILWHSPAKEIKISPDALKAMDQTSGTSFIEIENLFIHEVWELSKRYLDTKTIGFTFINKNERGLVSYGYVDYKDVIAILDKNNIPCNANGYLNTSYREAIQNKEFNFSIVQFGSDDFKANPNVAFQIQNDIFNNPKVKVFNASKTIDRFKLVQYEISSTGPSNNEALFSSINSYFSENLEQFYNLKDDKTNLFLKKEISIKFNKIKVEEIYKLSNGAVSSELNTIELFNDGSSIGIFSLQTLRKYGITINFKPLENFIKDKNFEYFLTAINAENFYKAPANIIINKIEAGLWKSLITH